MEVPWLHQIKTRKGLNRMAKREMTGAQAFLETLRSWGTEYVFGVPGTTEAKLLDTWVDYKDIKYILTTHESVAVSMADGYSRASGKPGVVSLHTNVGLANGIGQIHNAKVNDIPLVITAGIKHTKIQGRTAFTTSHDIQESVKQYTKWDWTVLRPDAMSENLSRALKIATTYPTGPTFLAIPEDMQSGKAEMEIAEADGFRLPSAVRACPKEIEKAARMLLEAERPVIVTGSNVTKEGGWNEIIELAELTGVPVAEDSRVDFASFPTNHPQYVGPFNAFADVIKKADVILIAGMRLFTEFSVPTGPVIPETAKLIHMHSDPFEVAKIYPVSVGLVCDCKSGLRDLVQAVKAIGVDETWRQKQLSRASELNASLKAKWDNGRKSVRGGKPIQRELLVFGICDIMDDETTVVNEGVTTGSILVNYLPRTNPKAWFATSGGCLGWGTGAALGVKIAWPERKVVALLGDGCLQFGIQALATAAKMNLAVTYVVAHNDIYAAVKEGILRVKGRAVETDTFLGTDISGPDYAKIAEGFGLTSFKVTEPEGILPTLRKAVSLNKPTLVDVYVESDVRLVDRF